MTWFCSPVMFCCICCVALLRARCTEKFIEVNGSVDSNSDRSDISTDNKNDDNNNNNNNSEESSRSKSPSVTVVHHLLPKTITLSRTSYPIFMSFLQFVYTDSIKTENPEEVKILFSQFHIPINFDTFLPLEDQAVRDHMAKLVNNQEDSDVAFEVAGMCHTSNGEKHRKNAWESEEKIIDIVHIIIIRIFIVFRWTEGVRSQVFAMLSIRILQVYVFAW